MSVRVLIAVLVATLSASSAGALDITACGQIVPDNDIGVLQTNLDCSAGTASRTFRSAPEAESRLRGRRS
jgi:hypothetical protein